MVVRFIVVAMAVLMTAAVSAHSSEYANIQVLSQVEALFAGNRDMDTIVASDVILKHAPKSADLLVKCAEAYAGILRRDIASKYKSMDEMTPETRAYADGLYQANLAGFAAAEALGWREQDGQL